MTDQDERFKKLTENPIQGEIAILCQHFYPEMLSTGKYITEMAVGLAEMGYKIRVYCAQPTYRDSSEIEDIPSQMDYYGIKVFRSWSVSSKMQHNILFKFIAAWLYLMHTAWMIFRDRQQIRGVIVTTNPPLIGLIGYLFNRCTKTPFITIIHDVYPEVAIKLGILKENSIIAMTPLQEGAFWEISH